MPFAPARRRPHAAVAGGVLGLHLLLLLGLLQLGTWADRSKPVAEQVPVVLRLLPLPRMVPVPSELQPGTAAKPAGLPPAIRNSGSHGAVPRPPAPGAPQPITVPAAADGLSTPATTDAAAAASSAPASAPPPLDLRLHRGMAGTGLPARNPALDDPRANVRAPRRIEDRIAALLGGGNDIVETALADGSVMLRRGSSCVIARPNRSQAIDPFNSSVSPKPRLIDHC